MAELIFVASLWIVWVIFVVVGREEAVMLLMSLPHLYLFSERFFRRIVESLKDEVNSSAGLAPLLDRILCPRSVFFLSMSLESLKDVVTGGAGLAPLLDRILYSRSVFFLSMKDSRCLQLEEPAVIDPVGLILTLLWSLKEVTMMIVFILAFIWKLVVQT